MNEDDPRWRLIKRIFAIHDGGLSQEYLRLYREDPEANGPRLDEINRILLPEIKALGEDIDEVMAMPEMKSI